MLKLLKGIWYVMERGLKLFGKVNSILLLSIFYYLILGPVAIVAQIVKVFKLRPSEANSYWLKRDRDPETVTTLRRQF